MAWLTADPTSVSTLRAVSLLLRAIRAASSPSVDTPPCISADACLPVMLLLEPNLASESRLLRLSTMRVLVRYDPLRFEQEDHGVSSQSRDQDECNFFEVAEAVEALPISVASERNLIWRLGQLEVLGRSGRLPRPYARVMATHALGLLRVKFSGVWPRARAIIAALYQQLHQRELVWQPIHAALRKVMPPPVTRPEVAAAIERDQEEQGATPGSHDQQSQEDNSVDAAVAASTESLLFRRNGDHHNDNKNDAKPNGVTTMTTTTPLVVRKQPQHKQQQWEQVSGLRKAVPPPQPWVPRLLSHAAALDGGPTEEMELPVALQGVFRDESVRTGLQPESGEVPLWASTDADSAFAQVRRKIILEYNPYTHTLSPFLDRYVVIISPL